MRTIVAVLDASFPFSRHGSHAGMRASTFLWQLRENPK
jgi:hypothetical protein